MASGRFISRTLGGSRKYAALTTWFARCLYDHLVLHTDVYGRVDADPIWINGQILTRCPATPDEINAALQEMHRVGLIGLYEVDGNPYLEIAKFHEHNTLYLEREPQATIPFPDGTSPPPKPTTGPGEKRGNTRAGPEHGFFRNTARTLRAQCANDAGKVRGKRSEVEVEAEGEEEEKTPPTPPQPEALAKPGELPDPTTYTNDTALLWWIAYQQHPTGQAIAERVTRAQLRTRWGPHEAHRLAKLHTPAFVDAAWRQAQRDAQHNVERTFVLILEGQIAPDHTARPKRTSDRPKTTQHPEHGIVPVIGQVGAELIVELPDGNTDRVSIAA